MRFRNDYTQFGICTHINALAQNYNYLIVCDLQVQFRSQPPHLLVALLIK
jgi:hypothetical protein